MNWHIPMSINCNSVIKIFYGHVRDECLMGKMFPFWNAIFSLNFDRNEQKFVFFVLIIIDDIQEKKKNKKLLDTVRNSATDVKRLPTFIVCLFYPQLLVHRKWNFIPLRMGGGPYYILSRTQLFHLIFYEY